MVFKRRKPLSTGRRIRDAFYPPSGWRRAIEYMAHRLKRLPDSPHRIAIGFACGVFASFSPFFGLHFVYAGICAMVVRGNVLASLIGTFFGNPLTFPIIATASLGLGRQILGIRSGDENFSTVRESFMGALSGIWQTLRSFFGYGEPAWDKLATFWSEVFVPYYVGGILPGLAASAALYILARPVVAAYQARRRSRLLARAKVRLHRKKVKAGKLVKEGS